MRGIGYFLGVMSVALAGVWAGLGGPMLENDITLIYLMTILTLGLVGAGTLRVHSQRGRADIFHPMVIPVGYVAFSFLAPVFYSLVTDSAVGSLRQDFARSPETVGLLCLGIIGFAIGAWVPFKTPYREVELRPVSGEVVLLAGRLSLLFPVVLATEGVVSFSVVSRGLDQTTRSTADSVGVLAGLLTLLGPVLILSGRRIINTRHLLGWPDVVVLGVLIVLLGATGARGDVIGIFLTVLVFYVWRGGRQFGSALVVLASAAVFAVAIGRYRALAAGGSTDGVSALQSLLGDMAVAASTTGSTAALVPQAAPFEMGSTIWAGLLRQVPGPVINSVMGAPDDTGTFRYRDLVGFSNPNQGLGFSIPAEGYLNFGAFGVFVLCLLFGLLAAWGYSRSRLVPSKAVHVFYPLLLANLPFALRSDILGITKGLLYPVIMTGIVFAVAHWAVTRKGGRRERGTGLNSEETSGGQATDPAGC